MERNFAVTLAQGAKPIVKDVRDQVERGGPLTPERILAMKPSDAVLGKLPACCREGTACVAGKLGSGWR